MDRKYIVMILSWLFGCLGADRFYQGQIFLGILKMITCGGCLVWWLIDAAYYTYQAGKKD